MKGFLEYITEMSESDKRRFRSLIENLLSHRLKIEYAGGKAVREIIHHAALSPWRKEVREFEDSLFEPIHDAAPGLKAYELDLRQIYAKLVRRGPFQGELRRQYPKTNFPDDCPFALEQIVGSRVWNELKPHISA